MADSSNPDEPLPEPESPSDADIEKAYREHPEMVKLREDTARHLRIAAAVLGSALNPDLRNQDVSDNPPPASQSPDPTESKPPETDAQTTEPHTHSDTDPGKAFWEDPELAAVLGNGPRPRVARTPPQERSRMDDVLEDMHMRRREESVAREEALRDQPRAYQNAFKNLHDECQQEKPPRTHHVSRVLAGGLFALFSGSLIQALQLFGAITMNSGHIFMFIAFVAGVLIITTEILPLKPTRHKVWAILILAVVLGIIDVAAVFYAHTHKRDTNNISTGESDAITAPSPAPRFQLRIGQAIFGYEDRLKGTAVLLDVEVKNFGTPSTALEWKAYYKSSTLDTECTIFRPVQEPYVFPNSRSDGQLVFYGSRSIDNVTALSPVTREVPVRGRLAIFVPGNREEEIASSDAVITVITETYNGTPATGQFRGGKGSENLFFLPGEEIKPNPNLRKPKGKVTSLHD